MLQNVTKFNPCPICGKPDMCFSTNSLKTGDLLRICGRIDLGKGQVVRGRDGCMYICVSTKNGYTSFVDYETYRINRELQRKEWCLSHGYRYVPKDDFSIPDDAVMAEERPWELDSSIIEPLSHELLDKILRPWFENLPFCDYHHQKLMREWGKKPEIAESIFATWPIRSMPPEDNIRKECPDYFRHYYANCLPRKQMIALLLKSCHTAGLSSPAGIPGFYQDEKTGEWRICAKAGILYPVYDVHGLLYGLRIGVDNPNVSGEYKGIPGEYYFYRDSWYFSPKEKPKDEKSILAWRYGSNFNRIILNEKGIPSGKTSGKYVNFSSFSEYRDYETHTIKNKFPNGSRSGSRVAVYRPDHLKTTSIFWITEGEKKSMVIAAYYGVTVICLPGVKTYSKIFEKQSDGRSILDILIQTGGKMAIVAYDADKNHNEMVAGAEEELIRELSLHGIRTAKTDWHESMGKGIDDGILDGIQVGIIPVKMK